MLGIDILGYWTMLLSDRMWPCWFSKTSAFLAELLLCQSFLGGLALGLLLPPLLTSLFKTMTVARGLR